MAAIAGGDAKLVDTAFEVFKQSQHQSFQDVCTGLDTKYTETKTLATEAKKAAVTVSSKADAVDIRAHKGLSKTDI